jgi:hypothetical protein
MFYFIFLLFLFLISIFICCPGPARPGLFIPSKGRSREVNNRDEVRLGNRSIYTSTPMRFYAGELSRAEA